MSELKFKPEVTIIKQWLTTKIAAELDCPITAVSTTKKFVDLGLDSIILVTLAADLEEWADSYIDPTIFWEFEDIDALSNWLVTKVQEETTA